MSTEKRIAAGLAVALVIFLLLCTFAAQWNLNHRLPRVTAGSINVDGSGAVVFPPESVTCGPDGTCCVYRLTEEKGPFGIPQYFVKEVRIYTEQRADGLLSVQGLYNFQDPYVLSTSGPLHDGAQVVLQNRELQNSQAKSIPHFGRHKLPI